MRISRAYVPMAPRKYNSPLIGEFAAGLRRARGWLPYLLLRPNSSPRPPNGLPLEGVLPAPAIHQFLMEQGKQDKKHFSQEVLHVRASHWQDANAGSHEVYHLADLA